MNALPPDLTQLADFTSHGVDARWLRVINVIERLSDVADFKEVCAKVAQSARELTGAEGITFVLRENDLCHYVEEDAIGPLWKGQRFPMAACISGWSMLNATVAIVPDVYADPRIPTEAYEPTFVRSLIMVPIGQDAPLGAIGAYWSKKRSFETETVMMLEVLARAAASAIAMVSLKTKLTLVEERSLRAHEVGSLGAWTLNTESCHLHTSLIFRQQLGRFGTIGLSYADFINALHSDDREALRASISHAADYCEGFNLACRVVWPNKQVRWLDLHADPVLDSKGRVSHLCGVAADIGPSTLPSR